MARGPTDEEVLARLQGLIEDTMHRCFVLERAIRVGLREGHPTKSAEDALQASQHALGRFRLHLAQTELKMARGSRGTGEGLS